MVTASGVQIKPTRPLLPSTSVKHAIRFHFPIMQNNLFEMIKFDVI